MHRKFQLYLAVIVVVALTTAVCRAEEPSMPTTNKVETVVVEATRIQIEAENTPTETSIITRQQLEEKQVRTVGDALREEVGIDIARQGQPGGQSSVFMRGANSNQTLVLIDGIRVNSGFNNAFDFANLSVDNIERIEVLRGPQSTLYGSEAMGGVINIVTKRGAPQPTGSATFEAGSFDSFRPRASFATTAGKVSLSGEGSYFTSENDRINSDASAWNGSGRVTWDALERLRISFLTTYLQSEAGSPNDKFTNDPNDYLRNENTLVGLTLDASPTEWWNAKVTLSHAHERAFFSGLEPNPPFFFGDFVELTVTDRDQIDFQNIFSIGEQHKILLGGIYDNSHADDNNTFGSLDKTISDKAIYGQYDFSPIERVTLTAGGRVDDYSTVGTHGTYRFGGRFTTPVTETILRANVGTGFRAPSFVQTFPPFGNPNLKAEESLGWDVGIEQPLADGKVHVGASYFQNEFDNLVISVPAGPPFFSQLANAGRARTLGIESWASWNPLPELTLSGTYTWLAERRDLSHDTELLRHPEHGGRFTVDYKFLKRFDANVNTTLVGQRADRNFAAGTSVDNPGYVKVDLGLACEVCKYFTIFGRIENLLDDQYEEVYGFPALGRTFWGGGTFEVLTMNGTLAIPVAAALRRRAVPNTPAERRGYNLVSPLVIAIVAHLAVAGILAAIPLYRGLTQNKFQPATVRFTFAGLAEPGGNPAAGGQAGADAPASRPVATILDPELSATSLPPMPQVVIGVFDPVAVTADTHLNVQIGSAPPPGAGTGHGTGTGIGDGSQPGIVGLGGNGPGGGTGGYPSCRRSPKPSYPDLARQRGWEGTTVLLVEVRTDGTVGLVEVRQSSGHRLLDDTSIDTVRNWKFNPAHRDDVAVVTWVEIPIRYQLNQG